MTAMTAAASCVGIGLLLLAMASPATASGDRRVADAAKGRDWKAMRTLVSERADVNGRQPDGATALHWAAHWDDVAAARDLVKSGAVVDAVNDFGVTPLSLASTNGSAAMVRALVDAGANPNLASPSGETPLMTASRTGELTVIDTLVAAGADVAAKESTQGQTALMWAVAEGHTRVVLHLLAKGADASAKSKSGFTPLLFAAREGRLDLLAPLVAAGAKVGEAAADGSTALVVAVVRGHVAFAKQLLDRGADPNAAGTGYTALHWAAGSWETELTGPRGILTERDEDWAGIKGLDRDRLDLVKALLAHGADPNVQITRPPPRVGFSVFRVGLLTGATPFYLAAMSGAVDIMRTLAGAGADATRPARDKSTPLMAAAGVGRVLAETLVTVDNSVAAARLAVELGNDVRAANAAGETALHGAAHIRADALVQLLADRGADLNAANRRGETPLMIAERTVAAGSAPVIVRTSTGDLLRALGALDFPAPPPAPTGAPPRAPQPAK